MTHDKPKKKSAYALGLMLALTLVGAGTGAAQEHGGAETRTIELEAREGHDPEVVVAGVPAAGLDGLLHELQAAKCWQDPDNWCMKCAKTAAQFCDGCLNRSFDCSVVDAAVAGYCKCSASCSLCTMDSARFVATFA